MTGRLISEPLASFISAIINNTRDVSASAKYSASIKYMRKPFHILT